MYLEIVESPRKVYRVENRKRIGPYLSAGKSGEQLQLALELNQAHSDDAHPSVVGIMQALPTYKNGNPRGKCAFGNLAALKEWFDGFLPNLERAGYVIGEYLARERVELDSQIVFNPTLARRLREFSISEL